MQKYHFPRLLIVLLTGACSGRVSPAPADVAEDDFPSIYAQTYCDAVGACCAAASTQFTRADCIAAMTRGGQSLLAYGGASAVYDGKRARDCIEKTRTILSGCLTSVLTKGDLYSACSWLKVGTVPTGASCTTASECAPVAGNNVGCVATEADSSLLECFADRPGMVDEPCMDGDPSARPLPGHRRSCADGLFCNDSSRCQPLLPAGATCTSRDYCSETSWCRPMNPNDSFTTRVCTPKVALGTACTLPMQCTSESCYQGTCAPGEPLAPRECKLSDWPER